MTDLEGKQLGGCEILAKLGQGGMGAVYKARQIALDRVAAVKVLPPQLSTDEDFIARFNREAAAAAQLSHPNIVQVYAAGMQDDLRYFVMEFVDGESVQQRLKRKGRIPPDEALAICMYVIHGLDYAWQRSKLIHRDIKPDNIFLSSAGEVKLGDLGLAKTASGPHSGLTLTGSYMGTPYFISPEQARGLKTIDFHADMYSLGCTLFHMVTGHLPFEPGEGDNAITLMFKHVNEPVPDIRQVWPACPASLAKLITRMIQKQPEERFASYDDLVAAMKHVVADLRNKPVHAGPLRPPTHRKLAVGAVTPAPPAKPAGQKAKVETRAPAKPATTTKPLTEDQGPSFGLIMGGTLLFSALVVGLIIWKPWRGPVEEPVKAPPVATVLEGGFVRVQPQVPEAVPKVVPRPVVSPRPILAPAPLGPAFIAEVGALPPEQQVVRVVAKLKELNLDYDGRETHEIAGGAVVALTLPTESIHNITPLAALRGLKQLRVASPHGRVSALTDLGPLAGLPLTLLDCHASAVTSLTPLMGLPLEELDVHGCLKLASLMPLKGMKLRRLNINANKLPVDFTVLQGMPLEELQCAQTQLHDLTFLQGAPLKVLECDALVTSDARQVELLRAFKTLAQINEQPAAEFWKSVESRALLLARAAHQPEVPAAAWQNALNLLPLIEPASDALRGDWAHTATALIGDRSRAATLEIPYRPPEEYDFRVEFALLRKGCAGIQCMSKAGHSFTWNCFHAGGALFGFEAVDEKPLPENSTAISVEPPELGRRYVSLVEVRNGEVRGFLDGRLISFCKTDYANLKAGVPWRLRDATLLGLGCQLRTAFYSVSVREVTGKGTFTRPHTAGGTPKANPAAPATVPDAPVRRD
jgi:serine/threonine protein kinase